MAYYAYYGTVAEFEILSEAAFKEFYQQLVDEGEGRATHLDDWQRFDSFTDAKNFLIMHLAGDVADAQRSLNVVRKLRKKNLA